MRVPVILAAAAVLVAAASLVTLDGCAGRGSRNGGESGSGRAGSTEGTATDRSGQRPDDRTPQRPALPGGTEPSRPGTPPQSGSPQSQPGAQPGSSGGIAGAAGQLDPVLVGGVNAFAFDLYRRLDERPGNLFFSPASVSIAFAMTYAGARGETAEQIAQTLHLASSTEAGASGAVHGAYGALIQGLNQAGEGGAYKLSIANALYGQEGHPFQDGFLRLLEDGYGAGLRRVDFRASPDAARQRINDWVEERTNDKIQNLLPPGSVSTEARLVLVNAIYFKGDWARKFDKEQTLDEPFHADGGRTVTVPLMRQKAAFPYTETTFEAEGRKTPLQILEMPYQGEDLSMVILLPGRADGLAALEASLDEPSLRAWLGQLRAQNLTAILPRFRTTSDFALKSTLAAMGMPAAFEPGGADFSGMDGTRDLYISAAVHKAYVDVNEEGTEAAAATGITMTTTTAVPQEIVFRADHPFLFLIRDRQSGLILFLGRLAEPTAA